MWTCIYSSHWKIDFNIPQLIATVKCKLRIWGKPAINVKRQKYTLRIKSHVIIQCLSCWSSMIQFNHMNQLNFFLIAEECWTFFSRVLLMQSRTAAPLKGLFELHPLQMWIHISFSWGLFFSFPVWNSLNICQKYSFFILKTSPAQMRKTQQIAFHKNKLSNTISSFLVSQCNIVKVTLPDTAHLNYAFTSQEI